MLFTVQKSLPLLQPGSSVVLNASIVASQGNPAFSVYSATKAAVRSFARTWAELQRSKMRKPRAKALGWSCYQNQEPCRGSIPHITFIVGERLLRLKEKSVSPLQGSIPLDAYPQGYTLGFQSSPLVGLSPHSPHENFKQ